MAERLCFQSANLDGPAYHRDVSKRGAAFFDLDAVSDQKSPLPHMLPSPEDFASAMSALGVGDELAHSSIRFGIGRFNTREEVDFVADLVVAKVKKLREMSPLWEMHREGIDLKSIAWTAH